MKLKTRLIAGFLILALVSGIIGTISLYQLSVLSKSFEIIPKKIETLSDAAIVFEKTSHILYYDEILTQSVRNYAFTGNTIWKDRYLQFEPILSTTLESALHLYPIDKAYFEKISESNTRLVEMEKLAISFTDNGKSEQAISLLESQEYAKYKQEYSQVLEEYSTSHNVDFGKISTNAYESISDSMQKFSDFSHEGIIVFEISLIFLILLSLFLGYFFAVSIVSPFSKLQKNLQHIAKGKFDIVLEPEGPDEVKELIVEFNEMIQELKKLDYTKRNITSIVSHELRTPLVPIMGYLDILLADKSQNLTPDQKNKIIKIQEKCHFMKNLITDIIDLNKIHERHLPMSKQIISLDEILQNVEENFEHVLKQKNIEIHINSHKIKIDGDKTRLFQVFSNLVANAIDFCPKTDGKISISATYEKSNVRIIIKDNGKGLEQKHINKVFDAYYQVDDSYTREHGGTGIGLALCRGIIEGHDGQNHRVLDMVLKSTY